MPHQRIVLLVCIYGLTGASTEHPLVSRSVMRSTGIPVFFLVGPRQQAHEISNVSLIFFVSVSLLPALGALHARFSCRRCLHKSAACKPHQPASQIGVKVTAAASREVSAQPGCSRAPGGRMVAACCWRPEGPHPAGHPKGASPRGAAAVPSAPGGWGSAGGGLTAPKTLPCGARKLF